MARWRRAPGGDPDSPAAFIEAELQRAEDEGDAERATVLRSYLVMLAEAGGHEGIGELFVMFARELCGGPLA